MQRNETLKTFLAQMKANTSTNWKGCIFLRTKDGRDVQQLVLVCCLFSNPSTKEGHQLRQWEDLIWGKREEHRESKMTAIARWSCTSIGLLLCGGLAVALGQKGRGKHPARVQNWEDKKRSHPGLMEMLKHPNQELHWEGYQPEGQHMNSKLRRIKLINETIITENWPTFYPHLQNDK